MEIIKAIILSVALFTSYGTFITDVQDIFSHKGISASIRNINFNMLLLSCALWGIFYYL
jgi:hypothetical protein